MLENSPHHAYHARMSFLKDVSPTGAAYDLIAYIRADRPHNALLWFAACLPPAIMIYTFYADMIEKSIPPPRGIIYVESWPADRSREETIEAITKRQVKKDAFLEKQRQGYKALGRAIGMDVDEIERKAIRIRKESIAAAEKAEAEAEAESQRKAASANDADDNEAAASATTPVSGKAGAGQ